MPEIYIIFARKIFFRSFFGGRGDALPPKLTAQSALLCLCLPLPSLLLFGRGGPGRSPLSPPWSRRLWTKLKSVRLQHSFQSSRQGVVHTAIVVIIRRRRVRRFAPRDDDVINDIGDVTHVVMAISDVIVAQQRALRSPAGAPPSGAR